MRNSKMQECSRSEEQERQLDYERYTNFVDPSTMTIEHYRRKGIFDGANKYALKIEQWLAQPTQTEDNRPLVFYGEPGSGKKSMLIQWLDQHNGLKASKREKSLVLLHFGSVGGNNSNYFHAIYRLLIRLREALKIKQKVQLLEEKIRKYFAYWLDVCNNELQKQLVVNQTTEIYNKIVIVIEGIQNFLDADTGRESNVAFWLPRTFPKNIKVIITTSTSSEAQTYFKKIGCDTILLEHTPEVHEHILRRSKASPSFVDNSLKKELFGMLNKLNCQQTCSKNLYLFTELFLCSIVGVHQNGVDPEAAKFIKSVVEKKLNKDALKGIKSLDELEDFLMGFWEEQLDNKAKLKDLFVALSITQKGLTTNQLVALCGITLTEWSWISTVFKLVLVEYKELWMIHDATFKATVLRRYGITEDLVKEWHEKIADTLDSTPNSIRKLQQQTYHLYASKSYFKLKENISSIQNFLLLFNPNNKYDLSRYWQTLQEKGFDPVIEYNKAIEGFSMHYHPTEQNIFRIIVQISRFLKEFCDFETYFTPNFRHPPIQGNMVEMDKIGLLRQLQKLDIYVDNSCSGADEKPINHPSLAEQIKQLKIKYFSSNNQIKRTSPNNSMVKKQAASMTAGFRLDGERRTINNHILSEIQQLNVDVPKNREKFRAYYVDLLKDYMQTKEIISSDSPQNTYLETEEAEDDVQAEHHQLRHFRKDKPADVKLARIRETYNTADVKPTLYYYKRWIWIQFPWACISLQNDYSKTPELCLTSATQYMSVDSEAQFTRQALKIAIEAKERKKLMFTKKTEEELNSTTVTKKVVTRKHTFTSNLWSNPRDGASPFKPLDTNSICQASAKSRGNLGSLTVSLSALAKQLEAKKIKCGIKDEGNQDQCDEAFHQMEFIEKRKTFKMGTIFNAMSKNELLPKLKNEIKAHNEYELTYIKGHIEEKKKVINQIIYQNNKLLGHYRELKIKEQQSSSALEEGLTRKCRTFQDLDRKKDKTITEFCKSLLQKERLKIILKLCSENKTKNEQYLSSLNYLLQSLKKMIKWERIDMKKREEELTEIQQLNQRTQQAQKQKERNQVLLNSEIKQSIQQKQELERQINNMSSIISKQVNSRKHRLESNLTGDRLKVEQKTKQMQLQRSTQIIQDQLERMEKNYSKVAQLLEIYDFDYSSSPKFQKFMQQKERNRQLNIILFERKNKLEQLTAQVVKKRQQLDLCYTNTSTHDEATTDQDSSQVDPATLSPKIQELNKQLKTLKDASLRVKICFDNLAMQLKMKDTQRKQSIILQINNRLQKLKEFSEQKYNEFMANKKCNTNIAQTL